MCVCVWISWKYVVQLMLTLKFVMTSTGGGGRSQTSVTLLLVEWITRRFWGVGSPEGAGRWGLSTYHLYEEYTVLVFSFSSLSVGCCINSIYEYWLYILASLDIPSPVSGPFCFCCLQRSGNIPVNWHSVWCQLFCTAYKVCVNYYLTISTWKASMICLQSDPV